MRNRAPKIKTEITNNFNSEVILTSSTGHDLKTEVRAEAKKHNKKVTDFTTKPIKP